MIQKKIYEFLADTKVYVNGKSKEIQEKLFSLGYKWNDEDVRIMYENKPFLYIYKDLTFCYGEDMSLFAMIEFKEITAEQILALEVTEPSYRPFKNQEECWNEMLKHKPFGWLESKGSGEFAHVGGVYQFGDKAYITWGTNEKKYFTINSVFEDYTFSDGAPFGIKED